MVSSALETLQRGTVLDLGVELPSRAVGSDQLVAGVFFEVGGDRLIGAVKLAATATCTSSAWAEPKENAATSKARREA